MNCFCETTASARLWLYFKRLYLISSAIAYCISLYASFYAGLSCYLIAKVRQSAKIKKQTKRVNILLGRSFVHSFIPSFVRSLDSFVRSILFSFVRSFVRSFGYSFFPLFSCSFARSSRLSVSSSAFRFIFPSFRPSVITFVRWVVAAIPLLDRCFTCLFFCSIVRSLACSVGCPFVLDFFRSFISVLTCQPPSQPNPPSPPLAPDRRPAPSFLRPSACTSVRASDRSFFRSYVQSVSRSVGPSVGQVRRLVN